MIRTDDPSRRPSPRCGGAAVRLLLLLVLLGAGAVAFSFRDRLLHGTVEPPVTDTRDLEDALVRRLEERTAAVRAAPHSAEAWGMLGVAYEVHELFDEGIFCYERAQELDPEDFRWPYFLGLATRLGDRARALAHLQRAAELRADHAPLYFFIADGLLGSDDLDAAQEAFERALELNAELVAAHLGLAKVAIAQGDHETALVHLKNALALSPQSGEVHSLFVEAYRMAGDVDAMEEHTRLQAGRLGFEPVDDPLRFELEWTERITLRWRRERAERMLREGHGEEAVKEMRQTVSDAPDSFGAHLGLGHMLVRTGKVEEALAEYERAVELEPEEAKGHLGVGVALVQVSRNEEAVAAFERALELDPTLHKARNNMGALLVQLGEVERGLALLQESCEGMPNDRDAHINWARALTRADRPEQAESVYEIVGQLDPAFLRERFESGLRFAQAGQLEKAATEFRAVVVGDPERLPAHQNLARALDGAGLSGEAIAACREGLSHHPEDLELRQRLAWLLATTPQMQMRDGSESLALAMGLVAEQPADPLVLRTLAAACAETGDFEAAAGNLQKALSALEPLLASPQKAQVEKLRDELKRELALYQAGESYSRRP